MQAEASDDKNEDGASSVRQRHARVRVGDCVDLSARHRIGAPDLEGGWGHVKRVHDDGTFDVTSVLGNRGEKNVSPSRIANTNPMVLSARRRGDDELERASILAP